MVAVTLAAQRHHLYLMEPVIARSGLLLVFWQDNTSHFPTLTQAAPAILCALCTTVDGKQRFSTAGNIVDEKRSCLPKSASKLNMYKEKKTLILKK